MNTPEDLIILFEDLAQIYQTQAHHTLALDTLAHARRYRAGAECIRTLLRKQNESMATSINPATSQD